MYVIINKINNVGLAFLRHGQSFIQPVCLVTDRGFVATWQCGVQIHTYTYTRVGTLIVATIYEYLQLIQNRYMFRSFTVLHCSHQHCVQPVASDVEVVGYL